MATKKGGGAKGRRGNGKDEDEAVRRTDTRRAADAEDDLDGDRDPEDDKPIGHNEPFDPSGETLDEYFAVVAEEDDNIEKEQEALRLKAEPYKERIKGHRKKITAARDKLVEDGYPTLELNSLTQEFRLRRKADRLPRELDDNQKERRAAMKKAWKDFSAIPGGLGEAADRREAATAH